MADREKREIVVRKLMAASEGQLDRLIEKPAMLDPEDIRHLVKLALDEDRASEEDSVNVDADTFGKPRLKIG